MIVIRHLPPLKPLFRARAGRASVLAATLLGASACTPNLAVPPSALLGCENSDQCPSGYTCKEALHRCVAVGGDETIPEIVPGTLTVSPLFARVGTTITTSFSLSERPGTEPLVRLSWGGAQATERAFVLTGSNPATRAYTFTYTAAAGDPPGYASVVVTFVDEAANPGRGELTNIVEFDFKRPGLAKDLQGTPLTTVQILPGPTNPLLVVSEATVGSVVRVAFTVSEPLGTKPVVITASPAALEFEERSGAGLSYVYELAWSEPDGPQGELAAMAHLVDRAGNESDVEIGRFVVDTIAPERPAVDAPRSIIFERIPWASSSSNRKPMFTLTGAEGAVGDGVAYVIVYDGPEIYSAEGIPVGAEISRVAAGAYGTFGGGSTSSSPLLLRIADRPTVYLAAVDAAGNVSDDDATPGNGIQATQVRDVAWTASLVGKVQGSSFPNPHSFEARRQLVLDKLLQKDSVPSSEVQALGAIDGELAATSGSGSWANVTPGVPPFRSGSSMTYDSARARMVMYGGTGYFTCDGRYYCGLWEANGWRWQYPAVLDPEGDGNAPEGASWPLAFDTVRGVTVLFTGAQVWEWNGASWRHPLPSDPEEDGGPMMSGSALAFDLARRETVLFGLDVEGKPENSTWGWNGKSWRRLCASTECYLSGPQARTGSAMAYDAQRRRGVMFGGKKADGSYSDETWEWDGSDWIRQCTEKSPCAAMPSPRSDHAMAYDPDRGVMVLFGGQFRSCTGCDWEYRGDTWEWDGSTWLERCTSAECASAKPNPRSMQAMAYDQRRHKVVMAFGSSGEPTGDCNVVGQCSGTWEWDGSRWTRTDQASSSSPARRSGSSMAWDGASGTVLLFGGKAASGYSCGGATGAECQDTWAWDGERWSQKNPKNKPPARQRHAMAAIGQSGAGARLLMFGGLVSDVPDSTTWGWNGSDWALLGNGTPPARQDHAMAGGPSGEVVLFGGAVDTGTLLQDTAEWIPSRWQPACDTDPCGQTIPSARFGHAMTYLPGLKGGETVLFGGQSSYSSNNEVWHWNGVRWLEKTPDSEPAPHPRVSHALIYESDRQRVLLFGGDVGPRMEIVYCVDSSEICNDTWEWNGSSWERRIPSAPEGDGLPSWSGATETLMAFDEVRRRGLLFFDSQTWLWNSGAEERPAQVAGFSFDSAQAGSGAVLVDVEAAWRGGGVGYPNGPSSDEPGARLYLWDTSRFVEVAADEFASPAELSSFRWTLSADPRWAGAAAGDIARLFFGPQQTIYFALAPKAVNGKADAYGLVASDFVEVTVRYRLPDGKL
jgi:hypothetical protein